MDLKWKKKTTDEATDEESVKQQNIRNIFDSKNKESRESDSRKDIIGKDLKILTTTKC